MASPLDESNNLTSFWSEAEVHQSQHTLIVRSEIILYEELTFLFQLALYLLQNWRVSDNVRVRKLSSFLPRSKYGIGLAIQTLSVRLKSEVNLCAEVRQQHRLLWLIEIRQDCIFHNFIRSFIEMTIVN